MKYLLDTNICVFIFRRKFPSVLHRLHQTQPGEVGISAVTLAELRYGADKSCDPPKNHAVIDAFLTTVAVLEFYEDAARLYGIIRSELESRGTPNGQRGVRSSIAARSRKRSSKFRQRDASPRNTSQRRRNRCDAGKHQRMRKAPEKRSFS